MSERTTIVDESVERIQTVFSNVEGEFQKVQEQFQDRGNELRDQAEEQIREWQGELRKLPLVQRVETFGNEIREDASRRGKELGEQVNGQIEALLGLFQIPSRGEIARLEKKLNRISRRLNNLDKTLNQTLQATPSKPETAVAE
jgi:uncharacterized protein YukE